MTDSVLIEKITDAIYIGDKKVIIKDEDGIHSLEYGQECYVLQSVELDRAIIFFALNNKPHTMVVKNTEIRFDIKKALNKSRSKARE